MQKVIAGLNGNGIPAIRAYPAEKMPVLEAVQATVSLERMDHKAGTATVLVSVYCPAALGGSVCEDTAVRVCTLLRTMGAQCSLRVCEQVNHTELLCTEISALFYGCETGNGWTCFSVTLGGTKLDRVQALKVWRSLGDAAALSEVLWRFRLEELLLPDAPEAPALTEPFNLTVNRGGRSETYGECTLTFQRYEVESGGVRRIRQGIAKTRTANG